MNQEVRRNDRYCFIVIINIMTVMKIHREE